MMDYDYDNYDPCESCSSSNACDGWEAALCLFKNPHLMDDPDYDPFDI